MDFNERAFNELEGMGCRYDVGCTQCNNGDKIKWRRPTIMVPQVTGWRLLKAELMMHSRSSSRHDTYFILSVRPHFSPHLGFCHTHLVLHRASRRLLACKCRTT